MACILIGWELGDGLGHLGSFPLLTRELIGRGHRVVLAVKDLAGAEPLLGGLGATLLQAPVWLGSVGKQPLAASYPEILARVGYLQPAALTGRLRAWRGLLDLVAPDLALFNHSPSALLASRGLGFPRVVQGTGFTCPVGGGQRPVFPLWAAVDPERPAAIESQLLGSIDQALEAIGAPPLGGLERLFAADDTFLSTISALDPYRTRRRAPLYRGPVPSHTSGLTLDFPGLGGPRIFAYLKHSHGMVANLLGALGRSGASVLAYVSGIGPDQARDWSGPRVRVSERPLDLQALLPASDWVIHHGGHGTCADALLAGVPMVVLPLHVENWVNGRSLEGAGAGWMVGDKGPVDPSAVIERIRNDSAVREGARAIAATHAGLDRARSILDMADRIEALMAERSRGSAGQADPCRAIGYTGDPQPQSIR